MIVSLDLHVHSEASRDGRMPLEEIIRLAKARGLQGVAVTDHDVLLQNPPRSEDFLVIPGCEFSTERGHLLGLFLTAPIEPMPFPELIEAIHAQGGIAILAHPFEHRRDDKRIEPIAQLLDGAEIRNSRAARKNPEANAMAEAWAKRHHLPGTCGSDAHLPQELGGAYRRYEVPALTLEAVKAAILDPAAARDTYYCAAKHVYAARSQWTRLRKTHADWKRILKWCVFAVKCCLEDLLGRNISLPKRRRKGG